MEDMRYSIAVRQIVKIVRIVVKFHPLLTVTSLIFKVIFLQDWIEKEVSNQWKILKAYCQSTMRALLDPVTEKIKNLSKALQMHLHKEAAKGQLKAKLIGKLALFFATFFLLDTKFSSKYDRKGVQMQLLLFLGFDLLTRFKLWSQLQILRKRCDCAENSTSNFTFFILALVFANFYDNSLSSLTSMLCITIYLLCVLVVLRPRTDLGLFSFIIGVIGSITYNCYKFKFPTWIIASICGVLFSFKSWLDKYWLDLEQDLSTNSSMVLILSSIALSIAWAFLASFAIESRLSNHKDWLVTVIAYMMWSVRLYKFYPKDSSLPFTNTKEVNNLILTIVNVGMFTFGCTSTISSVVDYKYGLFIIISYVVFLFWLRRFLFKDLALPSTNTKGITGMILSLQSIATCDIVLSSGLEPIYFSDWLVGIICCALWWVRLHIIISQRALTVYHN